MPVFSTLKGQPVCRGLHPVSEDEGDLVIEGIGSFEIIWFPLPNTSLWPGFLLDRWLQLIRCSQSAGHAKPYDFLVVEGDGSWINLVISFPLTIPAMNFS